MLWRCQDEATENMMSARPYIKGEEEEEEIKNFLFCFQKEFEETTVPRQKKPVQSSTVKQTVVANLLRICTWTSTDSFVLQVFTGYMRR